MATHSYETRSSNQKKQLIVMRTHLKARRDNQTRQLEQGAISARRILRRPTTPPHNSKHLNVISPSSRITRCRSAQDNQNQQLNHVDETMEGDKQVGVAPPLVEILDTTADNGDKLDDKTMILSAPVASAFTSRRAESEDFVERKTAAPIQLKNSATDECCQLAKLDRVPPIDLDNQACREEKAENKESSSEERQSVDSDDATNKARENSVEIEFQETSDNFRFNSPSTKLLDFGCDSCKIEFESAKMLQQHNQSYHADKNYVCEICSKAFRFRSNLAEHRSVHTALKPFVCKFCGKASRLKGNLTKHILKHHKSEQLDYIGTDEIIIKKGKKSVKDPMAIEFLEKSMIVMTPTQAQSPGLFSHNANGGNSRHSTSNLSASDGSITPLNSGKSESALNESFLLSLGLDAGSLDLKAESSESDSSVVCGSSTTNDRLLEKCNLFMDGSGTSSNFQNESTHQDEEEGEMIEDAEPEAQVPSVMNSATASAILYNALSSIQQKSNGQSSGLGNVVKNWTSAIKAQKPHGSFLDGLAAELSNAQQKSSLFNVQRPNGTSSMSGGPLKATTCPECGKHVRKPRDLITHLATIHGIAPSSNFTVPQLSQSNKNGESNGNNGVQADIRQLLQLVLEMKSAYGNTMNAVGQFHKVEQLVSNIDSRVGRLEKQLEMTLNSVYTLVQLQTGINSQLSRFREESGDQLRNMLEVVKKQPESDSAQSTTNEI